MAEIRARWLNERVSTIYGKGSNAYEARDLATRWCASCLTAPDAFALADLEKLLGQWADDGLARRTINRRLPTILSMFRWAAAHQLIPAETFAALADDPGLELRVDGKLRPSGQARLVVGDPNAALIRRVEYQTRVDGGLWRAWQAPNADGTLWVDDPKLFLSGKHVIDVRARLAAHLAQLVVQPTHRLRVRLA